MIDEYTAACILKREVGESDSPGMAVVCSGEFRGISDCITFTL